MLSLLCPVQNFKTITQLKTRLWSDEISKELSFEGYALLQQAADSSQ